MENIWQNKTNTGYNLYYNNFNSWTPVIECGIVVNYKM